MTTKAVTGLIVAVLFGCLGLPMLLISAVLGDSGGCAPTVSEASGQPGIGRWDAAQLSIVATIVEVGAAKGVPRWGWVVAVATAMQESQLRNLPDLGVNNDHDSIGVFQQRPGQGWGTPQQLADPAYQAGKFYDKLLTVPGWQQLPLTQAAQAVQGSAYPSAYAKWTNDAVQLADTVGSANWRTIPGDLGHCLVNCPGIVSSDGQSSPDNGCLSGAAVLVRAATWLTAWAGGPVPYQSSSDPATWLNGYRRDCSGYASMALGLPGPGLDTAGMAARSIPIAKTDLRAGDLLINPASGAAGHVVIFDQWTDASMTAYLGYEQTGNGGTHHRVVPYPYYGGYPMTPVRV